MYSVKHFLKNKYIECVGCASCQNACAQNAIEMYLDKIDGYFPYVNDKICVNCGKCVTACPEMVTEKNIPIPIEGYAAVADDEIRMLSSSGGFFGVIAEEILNSGGVVYGVMWDEKLKAVHTRGTCIEDIREFRYSKYVQSDTTNIFRKVKKDLVENRTVLFSGTPCQIAGLKKYIEVEHVDSDNLILLDLICGSAPSSALWKMYLDEQYGSEELPSDYRFRDKTHGWKVISNVLLKHAEQYTDVVEDYYLKGFLENMMLRSACDECGYRKCKLGDITIGDFWKVGKYSSEINDGKGCSTVLVNTEKGRKICQAIKDKFAIFEKKEIEKLMDGGGFRNLSNPGIEIFRRKIRNGDSLRLAYEAGRDMRYDIGLVGEWCNHNYGSHLTYYALKKTLEKMGLSVLLIGPPVTWWKYSKNIYGDERFRCIPGNDDVAYLSLDEYDYEYLNSKCDMFCVGSDTTFNEFQFFDKKKYAGLAWTDTNKGRIIYGGSFGTYEFTSTKDRIEYLKYCFHRFDDISFREKAGVELAKTVFNVDSNYVLDPVFLLSAEEWRQCEKQPEGMKEKKFGIVFFYEENGHDIDTEKFVNKLEKNLGCEFYYVTRSESTKKNAISNIKIEELLWLIDHAEMVLTNSFHVTDMSIIFNRSFYAINRVMQLPTRIPDILETCGLENRMIIDYRYDEINEAYLEPIDYQQVNYVLQEYIDRSKKWLFDAVNRAKSKSYKKSEWNECDYLRRRVDELSTLVTKLIACVNDMNRDNGFKIENSMELKTTVSKEEFIRKFCTLADSDDMLLHSLKKRGYKKIAIYGIGIVGKVVIEKLQNIEEVSIEYYIDRSVSEYNGIKVYHEPQNIDVDVVIVTVLNDNDNIRRFLKSFYRELDILMVDDWIDEIYRAIGENI